MPTSIPFMMLPMSVFRLATTASLVSGVLACASWSRRRPPLRALTVSSRSTPMAGRARIGGHGLMARAGENGLRRD